MHWVDDALQRILHDTGLLQRLARRPHMQNDQPGQKRERNRYGDSLLRRRWWGKSQHDRGEPAAETMGDHQRDVMDRERHERNQPEKMQAARSLPATEQLRKPGPTRSESEVA